MTGLDLQYHIQSFDKRRDILVPGKYAATIEASAQHLLTIGCKAIDRSGRFLLALSGGSTPEAIYKQLASDRYRESMDWTKAWLFWSDERSVPPTHRDSNYRMAMDAGMGSLGIPNEQIFRMPAEENIIEQAAYYEKQLKEYGNEGQLDLVMLGMGEDAHTASLFPCTHALNSKERLVVANYVPKLENWRMSFTFTLFNKARATAIYALGKAKGPVVAKVLFSSYDPIRMPIQRVGQPNNRALWVLDQEAANPILERLKA